jgi:hypothetical protein
VSAPQSLEQQQPPPPPGDETSNIFTIFSPPEPVRHSTSLKATPARVRLVPSAPGTAVDDVTSNLNPDVKRGQTNSGPGEKVSTSQSSNATPMSSPALSSVTLTATSSESPSAVARQLGTYLEHEIVKQQREIDELRAEASEAQSQAVRAKEQEAAAISHAAAQARAAEEARQQVEADLADALKEAELQGSARQEAVSELSELRAVQDVHSQIGALPVSPSPLPAVLDSSTVSSMASNSRESAAVPLSVSMHQLASLQERLEALDAAQLISSVVRESVEDLVADFVELQAGIGVEVTGKQVLSSPAAVTVRKFVALSEVARSDRVFARQLRRKLQL